MRSLHDRFLSKVVWAENDCWTWLGAHFKTTGYAMFSVRRADEKWAPTVAHRVAYELFAGPIPEGLHIDHLCRNRGCVNPLHLEAVTQRVNLARGNSPSAIAVRTNQCQRGHEFTPENTFIRLRDGKTKRECRTCIRERDRLRVRPARRAA